MDRPQSIRRMLAPFFIANGLIYGLNSLYYSFMPKYLKDMAGLSEGEIGGLLSVGPLVGIVSMIIFGIAADKAKVKNNVLIFVIIVSAVVFCSLNINSSYVYLLLIFAVLMFFMSPFGGLLDAISLEFTTAAGFKYGPMRIMGSAAFGAISLIIGVILSVFTADVRIIFPAYVILGAGAVISVKMMPGVAGHARGKDKVLYRDFFKDKACLTLLLFMFVGHLSFGAYINFMQNFLEAQNNPSWIWGLNVFLTISFEIFFFWKFEYFFKKFTIKQIVIFCAFTQVLRYLSFALLPIGGMILITSLLTGSFATIIHYAAAYYINMTVKKEMRALSQTLMCSLSFLFPRFLSGVLGGLVVQNYGFITLMQICAVINILLILSSKFLTFREPVDKN
ncbi:MAG: MFS transporter [Oscillospiraceae bacterium]|nr:MFS transporter [Oscillospiraceae bacterium]